MIDAHVHLGSIPSNGKNWGSFREYKSIAKKLGINRYGTVPIGLPENFTNNSTPDNNSVLKESEKNKSVIPVYWFNVFDLPENIDNRYKSIKFHSDIGQINIDDQRIIDFVKRINLPVFLHTNESKDYSSLERVSLLAGKVNVPVIAVHSGSITRTFFKLDSYKFPDNVYFETSGIQYAVILKKYIKCLVRKELYLGVIIYLEIQEFR
ncbi:MAG TPA: hypothetical protein VJH65_00865 [Candidatus Nanoarchaeia archaeon]|nr:hypothetical protein [Candidatus Nanoarchaeia archaeon]